MIKYLEKETDFENIINSEKVLVDFYAEWCGPCKMQGAILEQVDSVEILKINTDNFPKLAQKYGVMSIPTLILFENGEIKEQSVGLKDLEEINNMVK